MNPDDLNSFFPKLRKESKKYVIRPNPKTAKTSGLSHQDKQCHRPGWEKIKSS